MALLRNRKPERDGLGEGRWRILFRRPAFWLLVFFFGFFVFTWPFIPNTTPWSGFRQYQYLFGAWALIILLIAMISLFLPPSGRGPGGQDGE